MTSIANEKMADLLTTRITRIAQLSRLSVSQVALAYIVGTLCAFMKSREFFRIHVTNEEERYSFEYLVDLYVQAMNDYQISTKRFKRMGDLALVMSGPFRGRVQRHKQLSYYHNMGMAAYFRLAKMQPRHIYGELAFNFEELSRLLHHTWIFRETYGEEHLLGLYERWQSTRDDVIRLELMKNGFSNQAFVRGVSV